MEIVKKLKQPTLSRYLIKKKKWRDRVLLFEDDTIGSTMKDEDSCVSVVLAIMNKGY